MQSIVEKIMERRKGTLIVEDRDDDKINRFILELRKMSPEVLVNCNVTALPDNSSRLIVDIKIMGTTEWIERALRETIIESKLEINTPSQSRP